MFEVVRNSGSDAYISLFEKHKVILLVPQKVEEELKKMKLSPGA
jgi:hypothetical protein